MTSITHPRCRARPSTRVAAPAPRLRAVPPLPAPASAPEGDTTSAMEIRRDGPRPVVVVSGELDLTGRDLLEALVAHVRADQPGPVEVDLGQVSFADTHGLEPVLEPGVVIIAVSPAVGRLLQLLEIPLGRSRHPAAASRHEAGRRRAAAVD